MDTRERSPRPAPVPAPARTAAGAMQRWSERTGGWVRCQVMGRPAQLWTRSPADTDAPAAATSLAEDPSMLKKARSRAGALLASSAELYREMALSALRLVRR
jgi:hypothetical protein